MVKPVLSLLVQYSGSALHSRKVVQFEFSCRPRCASLRPVREAICQQAAIAITETVDTKGAVSCQDAYDHHMSCSFYVLRSVELHWSEMVLQRHSGMLCLIHCCIHTERGNVLLPINYHTNLYVCVN
jgi:hypothetical protein